MKLKRDVKMGLIELLRAVNVAGSAENFFGIEVHELDNVGGDDERTYRERWVDIQTAAKWIKTEMK